MKPISTFVALAALFAAVSLAVAADWPQWGRDLTRNMVAPEAKNAPTSFDPGDFVGRTAEIDPESTEGVKWIAKLGSQAYGNPTVADGRVYVGTNNASPRDPKYKGDRSAVYCLDEKTGELIWQFNIPKLGAGKVSDWEYLGICSSPGVEGDRVYVVTNLCEVVCLDVEGLKNGNQGVTDESSYYGGGKSPIELGEKDADVIWRYNMADELGVFPHNITSNSPLIVDGKVYVGTSNGVDWSHTNIPNPRAPAFICLDAETGELLGEDGAGISARTLHCNWSSPSYGKVDGQAMVFWGGGDGYCYSFEPDPVKDADGFGILKEIWRAEGNPKAYRQEKYATEQGPSEFIGTPVLYDKHIYIAIGQDPEHGEGAGSMNCFNAKTGELVWRFTEKSEDERMDRTISSVAAADGLVYAADYAGFVHCLDAKTGEHYWTHDTYGHIWGSPLLADGKLYIGNEDGIFTILAHGKEKKVVKEIEFKSPIYSSAIWANGVIYIATQEHLYAVDGK